MPTLQIKDESLQLMNKSQLIIVEEQTQHYKIVEASRVRQLRRSLAKEALV